MKPLKSYRIDDCDPVYLDGALHISGNWYMFRDDKIVDIIYKHDNCLDCHGFRRKPIGLDEMKTIIELPVLRAVNASLIEVVTQSIFDSTIGASLGCSDVRAKCKLWSGNHYVRRVSCSHFDSVYAFAYTVGNSQPYIYLYQVHYGGINVDDSFAIDKDIFERIYNVLKEEDRK